MSKSEPVFMVTPEDVVAAPFPHVFAEPFVRPDLFARLKAEFPKDDAFDRNTTVGGRAGRDLYPGDPLYDELLQESPAWKELASFVDSQAYIDFTLSLFGKYFEEFGCLADADKIKYEQWIEERDLLAKGSSRIGRIGGRLKSAVGMKDAVDQADPNEVFVRMDIAQGEPGYEKTVHCDRPNRLTSMLIYFCNKDDIGMEGGDFRVHQHKIEKPIEKYERHPKPDATDVIAKFEPRENFGGMFIGCNNSYHSATAVTKSNKYRDFVYSSIASRSMSLWKS